MRSGKPIAAICHGPLILIEANAVKGRRMTSYPSIQIWQKAYVMERERFDGTDVLIFSLAVASSYHGKNCYSALVLTGVFSYRIWSFLRSSIRRNEKSSRETC